MSQTRKKKIILSPLDKTIVIRHRKQLDKWINSPSKNKQKQSQTRKLLPRIKQTEEDKKRLKGIINKLNINDNLNKEVLRNLTLEEQIAIIQKNASENPNSSRRTRNKKSSRSSPQKTRQKTPRQKTSPQNTIFKWSKF
jgi:hypothetical protein